MSEDTDMKDTEELKKLKAEEALRKMKAEEEERKKKEEEEEKKNKGYEIFFIRDDPGGNKDERLINLIGKNEVREYGFLGKRKKKMPGKKRDSKVEDNLELLYKGNFKDWEDVAKALGSKDNPLKEEEAKFYSELIKSMVYNVKLNINDLLNGKSFKYYYTKNNFLLYSRVFTNDRLYWQTVLWNNIKKDFDLIKILKINNKEVNLQTISKYQGKEYKKGFVEEYQSDFSFVGREALQEEDRKKIDVGDFEGVNGYKGDYTIGDTKYNYKIYPNGCILTYKNTYTVEEVKKAIIDMKMVSIKKTLVEEIKVMKIPEEQSYYISQNLKTTDFFPCAVIFQNHLDYAFMIDLDVDMLKLSDFLYDYGKKPDAIDTLGKFLRIDNLVTWDTFDLLINFLIIEVATRYKNNERIKKIINEFLDDWKEIKKDFRFVRKRIESVLKFFVKFYDSFQKRIMYDKIANMIGLVDKLINNLNGVDLETTKRIFEFLKKHDLLRICPTIVHCIEGGSIIIKETLAQIKEFIGVIRSKQGGDIINSARRIGTTIFGFFNISTNENFLINDIRTPSLFLGNLLTGEEDNAVAAVEKIESKKEKEEKKENEDKNLIITAKKMTNDNAIKYLVKTYLRAMGIKNTKEKQYFGTDRKEYKVEFYDEIKDWYEQEDVQKMINESGVTDELVSLGIKLFNAGDNVRALNRLPFSVTISQLLDDLYKNLKAYNERLDDRVKLYINEKKAEISRLNKLVAKLKEKEMYLPLGKDEPVTTSFLNKNGIDKFKPEDKIQKKNLEWLREQGVTDDIIEAHLEDETIYYDKEGNEVQDFVWDIIDSELSPEEMKKEFDTKSGETGLSLLDVLKQETQDAWGEDGYLYKANKNANVLAGMAKSNYLKNKKKLKKIRVKKKKREKGIKKGARVEGPKKEEIKEEVIEDKGE